jgi:hypothetical protein
MPAVSRELIVTDPLSFFLSNFSFLREIGLKVVERPVSACMANSPKKLVIENDGRLRPEILLAWIAVR